MRTFVVAKLKAAAWTLTIGAGVLSTGAVQAQEAEEERNYEASISLGYVGTTGNTESQTFETVIKYSLNQNRWTHGLEIQSLYTEQDDETSGERYFIEGKSDYEFEQDHYAFMKASYTDDRFTGYDYQATASAGYGHYFFNRSDLALETYIGLGYRWNAYRDNLQEDEGEGIVTLGESLEWSFSDSSKLTQSLMSEVGEDLTVTRFEIALVSTLVGRLATKIAFQARHISDVPVDREKVDTQTSVSLVYEF